MFNKLILVFVVLLAFSGCSLLKSGVTEYTLTPIETDSGEVVCCEATVYNSKDYDKLKFKFVKNTDGSMTVTLDEDGVSSSTPSQIQAENNSKFIEAVSSIIPLVKDR